MDIDEAPLHQPDAAVPGALPSTPGAVPEQLPLPSAEERAKDAADAQRSLAAAALLHTAAPSPARPPSNPGSAPVVDGTDSGTPPEPLTDPRFEKCGFAKLLGEGGFEYYFKKYEVTIGRRSKTPADVVLGDCALVSRLHARIRYNFDVSRWELVVEGKNGVTVNGTLHTPGGAPLQLSSQDLLQAGDSSMFFLLPRGRRRAAAGGVAAAAGVAAAEGVAAGAAGGAEGNRAPEQQQQQQQNEEQQQPSEPLQQVQSGEQQLQQTQNYEQQQLQQQHIEQQQQ